MSNATHESGGAGPSHRIVEIGVVAVVALLGLIAVIGGLQVGIGWGAEGPRAGFFPFYVGVAILISSAVNLVAVLRSDEDGTFATWDQLKQVFSVIVPTAVYVALIPVIGMYISSGLLIGAFMKWFGRYGWLASIAVAVAVPALTYFTFENYFLVPLPKSSLGLTLPW